MFCGLAPPLSVMLTLALRAPLAVGLKVTDTVHSFPGARLVPQLLVCEKSPLFVPVTLMLVMLSVEVLVLVTPVFKTPL